MGSERPRTASETDIQERGAGLTIRHGIRWDGRGRPRRTVRLAALLTALLALGTPAVARADSVDPVVADSMGRIAGGSGLAGPDGTGVDVALVDSGVTPVGSLAEPGRVLHGPDFSAERLDPWLTELDTFGHGTHIAGLIAGYDPVTGFGGVAPGARLVSVKVAGADGVTSLGAVLSALDWIRFNGRRNGLNVRVVNLSLGVAGRDYRSDVLAHAVEQLWRAGFVVVAAGGNSGDSGPRVLDMPADDPFVIAAGATDTKQTVDPRDDRVANFSSRSAWRPPDVVAPGTEMVSLRVPGSTLDHEFPAARTGGDAFFRGGGTSQAAAVTSGLAARLLTRHPGLLPDQVKAMIRGGAVNIPADGHDAVGGGRIDLARTLARPVPSVPSVRQTWPRSELNLRLLNRELRNDDRFDDDWDEEDERLLAQLARDGRHAGAVSAEWNGRRWSGRRWSGRRWSGATWIHDSDG